MTTHGPRLRWAWPLALALIFAACAERGERTSALPRGTPIEQDRDEHRLIELVHEPWVGDLDGMLERRLIRVLIVPSRTVYFLDGGVPSGIAVEYHTAFEAYVNKRFPPADKHLKVNVVLVPTPRDQLMPALLEGRGDIATGFLTITPGREAEAAFSEPTSGEVAEIVVTGPASPKLETLEDLGGKDVVVRRSSSYWEHLEQLNERLKGEREKPIRLIPAPEDLQDEDLMEMVNAGLLKTIVVDDHKAELWSGIFPKLELHRDLVIHSGGRYAWMMRKGSTALKKAVDAFIADHKAGTSFGNTVIRRYLGSTKFVEGATSTAEIKKFDAVFDLFRRYGERYDLDPLLLMAQGYQESRLDPDCRSRAGAVGIMQVLPSTARELDVGDVRQLEPNIHAGAKYLRQMIDTHFADDGIDELDRTLFAFAAYNAGPARIRRLRGTAEERELDPDKWFGNVELVVAQSVGREPTTYVSNIFKYYVAFTLFERDRQAREQARESLQDESL